jgi:hypothetical protein
LGTRTVLVKDDERILVSDLGIAKDLMKHGGAVKPSTRKGRLKQMPIHARISLPLSERSGRGPMVALSRSRRA